MKKLNVAALVLAMAMVASFGLTACDKGNKPVVKTYTQHDYISTTPATWNELDSTDANNDAIMGYIGSAFFSYDYKFVDNKKFNADGSINVDGIVPGSFTVNYDAAVALEDVTAKVDAKWGYTEEQKAEGGYAWKITLRNNLKWDDGTEIHAEDFVYTMQEQLSPLFLLGRSDTYYNNAVKIRNAKNYVYQGQTTWLDNAEAFEREQLVKGADGSYTLDGHPVEFALGEALAWLNGNSLAAYVNAYGAKYFGMDAWAGLVALASAGGRVAVTDESIALMEALITAVPAWGETAAEVVMYTYYQTTFPEIAFSEVGIYSEGLYDIILVLDQRMEFFNEDGSLSYLAAYNFSSLPLVKKDLYEKCKQEPQDGSELWTTTYCTSLETSASWGPYKLTAFQEGKSFKLERNNYWYGYALETNKGQYVTDAIETEVIAKEEAQQLAFWSGEVDGLGISVVLAPDYKDSPYAVYSPRVATFGINLYSDLDTLIAKGRNNTVLSIKEFRQALSLSLDRTAYNKDLSTANKPCLGLVNEDYYHNVANGEVYRYTIQAKETLLLAYGFEKTADSKWTDGNRVYDDVDAATKAMTGMNIDLAKEKLEEAWTELTSNPDKYKYDSSKPIQICLGDSEESEAAERSYNWINNWIQTLVAGTSFEGKIELTKDFTLGDAWADEFMAGNYDICTGGIGNAPFDPFYLIGGWIGMISSVNFHPYWAVDKDIIEHTLPVVEGFADSGVTYSLTALDWYMSLNGYADSSHPEWYTAPVEVRLDILARLERYGLETYYTIPTSRGFTASLHSAKWNYITDEYNTMLGFGGLRYITYNYSDAEWEAFVASHNGDLKEFYKGGN